MPKNKNESIKSQKLFDKKERKREPNNKQLLWKCFRRHRSPAAYEQYKVVRNEYTQTMRKAKNDLKKGQLIKA